MSLIKFGSNIPAFVKILRRDLELSQSQLAERLGVHAQYVSNVERGVQKNPISFCSLLYSVCPRDRREYLTDLISDAGSDRAVLRLKFGSKDGRGRSKKRL